jgi:ABC-type taurine transport system substrate-binding protein
LGTIHCSNLCSEIIEYTSPDEVAVCNLAPWRFIAEAQQRDDGGFLQRPYREMARDGHVLLKQNI